VKTKKHRTKIDANVRQGQNNRCASFHSERSNKGQCR